MMNKSVKTSRRFKKRYILLILLAIYAVWRFWPVLPVVLEVSKETTWITEPLKADGTPDFVKFYNDTLSEGVTKDNNAAVLLLPLIDDCFDDEVRPRVYERLDIEPPGEDFKRFVALKEYLKKRELHALASEIDDTFYDQFLQQPWHAEDHPVVAEWINSQRRVIEQFIAAGQRSKYYVPVIKSPGRLHQNLNFSQPSDELPCLRRLLEMVAADAMRQVGHAEPETIHEQLQACYRIGRSFYQRPQFVDMIHGIVMTDVVAEAVLELASDNRVTDSEIIREWINILEAQPSERQFRQVMLNERLFMIAILVQNPSQMIGMKGQYENFDINMGLRIVNRMYDRVNSILDAPSSDILQQLSLLDAYQQELFKKHAAESLQDLRDHAEAVGLLANPRVSSPIITRAITLSVIALVASMDYGDSYRTILKHDADLHLLRLALACEGYYLDHGRYPDSLDALTPQWLPSLPNDPFNGKPFTYRKTDDSCLLYSVGPDGVDDGGTPPEEGNDSESGDIVIELSR